MIRVTLHGFTGHPGDWDAVTESVALPILGHHPSVPAAGGSFAGEVERLAGQIAELGRPVHLLGYSMGARLALGIAAAHPSRVARLTLVGANPGLANGEDRRRRREADERWCRLLEERGLAAFVRDWEELPLFATQRRLPPAVRAAQRERRLAHAPRELAGALRALGLGAMPNLWPALASLEMPVELVAGAEDEKFCRLARRARAHLSRGSFLAVPGAGHNPLLERPRALAAALRLPAGDARRRTA